MKIQKGRSVEKIVEEQIQQWQRSRSAAKKEAPEKASVFTISREPGSRGNEIAARLAEAFGYELFDREIIQQMADDAKMSVRVLETLDEKGLNTLEDVIATLVEQRHLWPDQYIKHLMKIIGTIGRHGKAVIVGRGAVFIVPPMQSVRIRFIAPLEKRVQKVAEEFNISADEARRQIYDMESRRRSFTRRYFYTNIDEPTHYDVIINTEEVTDEQAVAMIRAMVDAGFKSRPSRN